jgi:hypothetical protein
LPGAQQVALAEQLCAESRIDTDTTDQQTIEYEQTDPFTGHCGLLAAPQTDWDRKLSGDALDDRLLPMLKGNGLGQNTVLLQYTANL